MLWNKKRAGIGGAHGKEKETTEVLLEAKQRAFVVLCNTSDQNWGKLAWHASSMMRDAETGLLPLNRGSSCLGCFEQEEEPEYFAAG